MKGVIVLLALLIVSQFVFSFYLIASYDRRASRYRIEETTFRNAVEYACTNYLEKLISSSGFSRSAIIGDSATVDPKVIILPNLATWSDYKGKLGCRFSGVQFYVGDFCEYGQIINIAQGRVYCRHGDELIILRSSSSDTSPEVAAGSRQRTDGDEGGASLDNMRIF